MISRPVALPVLARLVIKDTNSASRLWLARWMAVMLSARCPAATSASPPRLPSRMPRKFAQVKRC